MNRCDGRHGRRRRASSAAHDRLLRLNRRTYTDSCDCPSTCRSAGSALPACCSCCPCSPRGPPRARTTTSCRCARPTRSRPRPKPADSSCASRSRRGTTSIVTGSGSNPRRRESRSANRSLPVGLDHEDEFFGKQVIYRDSRQRRRPRHVQRRPAGFRPAPEAAGLRRCRPVLSAADLARARRVGEGRGGNGRRGGSGKRRARNFGRGRPGQRERRLQPAFAARQRREIRCGLPARGPGLRLFDAEPLARPRATALGHRRRLLPLSRQGHGQDDRDRRPARQACRSPGAKPSTTSTLANRSSSTAR